MSSDPVALDVVCTALMGFDPAKLPMLTNASRAHHWLGTNDIEAIHVVSNDAAMTAWGRREWRHLQFEPSEGWQGFLELSPESAFYKVGSGEAAPSKGNSTLRQRT